MSATTSTHNKAALMHLPARLVLDSTEESVRAARKFARECVRLHVPDCGDDLLDDVALVVSELVTNSVRYGTEPGDSLLVLVQLAPEHVRVEVHDPVRRRPRMREDSDERARGRGLHIVDALAKGWGTEDRPLGKYVWAEVAR